MIKLSEFLENNKPICYVLLVVILSSLYLTACSDIDLEQNVSTVGKETEDIKKVQELFCAETEEQEFVFYANGVKCSIPYIKISGCPNKHLEWKINHKLWKDACWVFECAEMGDDLYDALFESGRTIKIVGCYQYGQFLSVVYESEFIERLPGKISYAIVIDLLTGERILLEDMIKDREKMKDLLIHYFDNQEREIGLFINNDNDAEDILFYGGMTEAETVVYQLTGKGVYSEQEDGEVGSISYLFDSVSFYLTEDNFVVLPKASYYEPLFFEWDKILEAVWWENVVR